MTAKTTITLDKPVMEMLRSVARREKRTVSRQIELYVEKELGAPTPAAEAESQQEAAA